MMFRIGQDVIIPTWLDTMDSEKEMFDKIERFLKFAKENPDKKFYVTEIGCGIAGFMPEQIAPHFKNRTENVILPEAFLKELE